MSTALQPDVARQRKSFYDEIERACLRPLWQIMRDVAPDTPSTPCQPCIWKWKHMWARLQQAATLIPRKDADRRVLLLENPGLRGRTGITRSLYAGLQLVLPGEVVSAHRHSQTALRFVLHGRGAYTAVDDAKIHLNFGDFVITPSWAFHDHGNPSPEPVVWMDGLDVPLVETLDARFMEKGPERMQPIDRTGAATFARFGHAMKPVNYQPRSRTSPLLWYPYDRARAALDELRDISDPHPCWGFKLQHTNPVTGDWAMPTIGTFMQILPRGFNGKEYRSTDSTVYAVVEGNGRCLIDGQTLAFESRDVFVCPSWRPYTLQADEQAVIFSFSDRPAQQAFDLWREAF